MTFRTQPSDAGQRLDRFLQARFPDYSRARIQDWIRKGRVRVNGKLEKQSYLLRGEEEIEVEPSAPEPLKAEPEPLPLKILYQDQDVVAVDKPAGMVVHAGAGCRSGTLVNALLYHFGEGLSTAGGELRPGIVHRLDRYTSGVILVARNDTAHRRLAEQFSSRQIEKIYLALVHGEVKGESGRIEKPIARDPNKRIRMTARLGYGRPAWTEYRVLRRFPGYTLLEVRIGTGRTHQIRAHLASIGHPVVGDRLYGAPARIESRASLGRYFLHAHRITFRQPSTGVPVTVEAPLPKELESWMGRL